MTRDDLVDKLLDLADNAARTDPPNMIAPILALAFALSAEYRLPGINPRRPSHVRPTDPDPQDVGPGAS